MNSPDKKAAIGYFVFSGLATFLAFFLPVYFLKVHNLHASSSTQILILDLFLFAALFQGQYRLKTTVSDLGLKKAAIWKKIIDAGFYFSLLCLLILNMFMLD